MRLGLGGWVVTDQKKEEEEEAAAAMATEGGKASEAENNNKKPKTSGSQVKKQTHMLGTKTKKQIRNNSPGPQMHLKR